MVLPGMVDVNSPLCWTGACNGIGAGLLLQCIWKPAKRVRTAWTPVRLVSWPASKAKKLVHMVAIMSIKCSAAALQKDASSPRLPGNSPCACSSVGEWSHTDNACSSHFLECLLMLPRHDYSQWLEEAVQKSALASSGSSSKQKPPTHPQASGASKASQALSTAAVRAACRKRRAWQTKRLTALGVVQSRTTSGGTLREWVSSWLRMDCRGVVGLPRTRTRCAGLLSGHTLPTAD